MPVPRTDAEMEVNELRPQPKPCDHGFTLIELIVVIGIIAVLIGFLFPAFSGVQNQAKKVQAKNDLTQIVTAVNAYYTEYGKYPIAGADGTPDAKFGPGGTTNDQLFDVLRADGVGRDDPTQTGTDKNLNPRRIVFLTPPVAKAGAQRNGIIPDNESNPRQYFDPWGSPYLVRIDANYDNQVGNPYGTNGAGSDPIRAGLIAWSWGKDQKPGKNNDGKFTNSDDVISWQ